jgi:hypothetical protein
MGADPRMEDAKRAAKWLANSVNSVNSVTGGALSIISKRDLHANVFSGRKTVDEVEGIIDILLKHYYLRPVPETTRSGPGRKPSQRFEVNPALRGRNETEHPPSQNSQYSQKGDAYEGDD